jgi:hypothetical protein
VSDVGAEIWRTLAEKGKRKPNDRSSVDDDNSELYGYIASAFTAVRHVDYRCADGLISASTRGVTISKARSSQVLPAVKHWLIHGYDAEKNNYMHQLNARNLLEVFNLTIHERLL